MAYDLVARLVMRDEMTGPMRAILKQTQMLDKVIGTTDKTVESFSSTTDTAAKSDDVLAKAMKLVTDSTDRLSAAAGEATAVVDKLADVLEEAGQKSDKSSKKLTLMERAAKTAGQGFVWLGNKANNVISGIGRGLLSLPSKLMSLLTHPLSLLGVGGGLFGVTKVGLDMVIQEQSVTTAFEVMLGSAEKARERVEELTAFAGQTPYKREEIYEASRILQVFTGDALSTGAELTRIGDIAAGTQQDFVNVALWMGRLYDAMKSGRPVGEMTSRLQEMGAISGESRAIIEALAESGYDISKTWPTAMREFSKFDGMMEKMSGNLQNLLLGTKTFFTQNVIKRIGYGLNDAIDPFLRKFRQWRGENKELIAAMGTQIQQFARSLMTNVIEKIERAFRYIKTNYFDNPEFMELDFWGKVRFVIEDMKRMFNEWYNGGGKEQIENIARNTSQFISDALKNNTGPLVDAAFTIGKEIGAGLINGLNDFIGEHPVLSAFLVGGATPGPVQAKLVTGGATLVKGIIERDRVVTEKFKKESEDLWAKFAELSPEQQKAIADGFEYLSTPDGNKYNGGNKHAGGLARVPYDGYRAILHKDERVLTAEQNREYSQGAGGKNTFIFTINLNGTGNTASDAEKLLETITREVQTALELGV